MQKTQMYAVFFILAAISVSSFTMAFAQTEETSGIESGIELGVGLLASGGASGALLSIIRVAGKALKNKPEGMDQGKFLTNIAVGTAIGLVLSAAGMSAEALQGNEQIITLAVISSNFMFVYIVNETLRPMFSKFLKNWGKENSLPEPKKD